MAQWRKVIVSGSNAELNQITSSAGISLISGVGISGSSASTGSFGYLNVSGDGVFGGNLTFGDAATDSVSFGADIDSNLIPNTDDTYDLGSATQAWQDLFIEGDITLTDAGSVKATAGNLTVDSEAATLVLDGHTGVDIDASNSGKVAIDGAGGIDIGVATDVAIDIDSAALDIDASGAITIDGTSTISIDGADDMNFTITSGTGGEDLTIAQLGANDSSIIIEAAGTGTDAIKIDATAGSMVIAPSLANAKTLTIGPASATQMVFTPHGTAASEKISLINTSGTADDAIKIDSVAGGLTLAAGNDSLHIDADGTDSDALNIDSAGGIDVDAAAAVDILAATTLSVKGATSATFGDDTEHLVYDGSGNVDFDAVALDIDASGAVTIDGATTVAIAGASTSTYGDDVAKWSFDGTGKLSTTGVTTVSVTPSGVMDIDSGGALTIDGTSITIGGDDSGVAISIGHSTSETTINDNLTITGDLTVNGDQTIISTTNLAVEDKFAVFASGSTSATDGGIIVSKQADGAGFALGYDIGTSRWVLDDNLAIAATDIVPDAYVGTVELGTTAGDTQSAPKYGSGAGSIYIKTDDNEIWIYA